MSNYTSSTSPGLDQAYKAFFETFYKLSDTPPPEGGTASRYASNFTPDATFILAGKVATGTQEITKAREAMWEHVVSRQHHPFKIFVFGEGSNEVMVYGDVQYTTKDGQSSKKDWAARAELVKGKDENVKMKYYQIYI